MADQGKQNTNGEDSHNTSTEREYTQLTPAQRDSAHHANYASNLDESQTCLKQVYVSTHERIDVTPENHDRLFNEICGSPPQSYNWPLVDRVKTLFRNHTKADFISRIIVENDSREDRLEETRYTIYEVCKTLHDYPYPKDAELKRRKNTRKGETLPHKLANDIYILVSIFENQCYDDMKDILSLNKSIISRDLNATLLDSSQSSINNHEIAILKDMITKCQSDIVSLKQDRDSMQKSFKNELKVLTDNVVQLNDDINGQLHVITTNIERCEGEKSSGITSVKNALKLVSADCESVRNDFSYEIKIVQESISNLNKKLDKQIGKLDSKLNDLFKVGNSKISVSNKSTSTNNIGLQNTPMTDDRPLAFSDVLTIDPSPNHSENPVIFLQSTPPHTSSEQNPVQSTADQRQIDRSRSSRDVGGGLPIQSETRDINTNPVMQKTTPPSGKQITTIITDRPAGRNSSNGESSRSLEKGRNVHNEKQRDVHPSAQNPIENDALKDDDDFTEYLATKTKRFYLGGLKSTVKTQKLINYVTNRGIKVTMLRVLGRNNGNSATLRINVEAKQSHRLLEPGFWPRGVLCKPWMTKSQLKKKYSNETDNDDPSSKDDDFTDDVLNNNRRRRYKPKSLRSDGRDYDRPYIQDQHRGNNANHGHHNNSHDSHDTHSYRRLNGNGNGSHDSTSYNNRHHGYDYNDLNHHG